MLAEVGAAGSAFLLNGACAGRNDDATGSADSRVLGGGMGSGCAIRRISLAGGKTEGLGGVDGVDAKIRGSSGVLYGLPVLCFDEGGRNSGLFYLRQTFSICRLSGGELKGGH